MANPTPPARRLYPLLGMLLVVSLFFMALGWALWTIMQSAHGAYHGAYAAFYEVTQAAHDAVWPIFAAAVIALPVEWAIGTVLFVLAGRRRDISLGLLAAAGAGLYGLFVPPLELPYALVMSAILLVHAPRFDAAPRLFRAVIGLTALFAGALVGTELLPGGALSPVLGLYTGGAIIYCLAVLVRPAWQRM